VSRCKSVTTFGRRAKHMSVQAKARLNLLVASVNAALERGLITLQRAAARGVQRTGSGVVCHVK
jgi:hypothetical protein